MLKKILLTAAVVIIVALAGAVIFVALKVHDFDTSLAKVYSVPLPPVARSTDADVIARGKHLAESVAGCAAADCHGPALAGGRITDVGPLGTVQAPNVTAGGRGGEYTDAEIARLILHGVKRDGHGVMLMPAQEINWLPDEDIAAIISYLRSVPSADTQTAGVRLGILAKVLDTQDLITLDVARRIDHVHRRTAPMPAPTATYGEFIARSCQGCHGEHLSGGPIPGAPASIPVPLNLTPHASGLRDWTFAEFEQVLNTGTRRDGRALDPFMPFQTVASMNDVEKQALWAYLRALPAIPFGSR